MADLGHLIDRLSAEAGPSRRLPPPVLRLVRWALLSIALMLLATTWHGVRGDLAMVMGTPTWLVEQGLALLTALLAGFAAISFSVPGRRGWERLVWLPAIAFWVLVLWESGKPDMATQEMPALVHLFCPYCFPVISIGSALFLAADMRRAAPVAPVRMMGLLLIAGGGMAVFGERMIHDDLDAPLLIAIQVVAILFLGALLAPLGRLLFRWKRVVGKM
ncbi:NrsF family protein [Niveispirillum sp. KHB5.9]|uniref:NrsF family protein n=1 Tax=Niveispirillum sp. KHB5.9 TaxID=3400269 RepID=UPI003A879B15